MILPTEFLIYTPALALTALLSTVGLIVVLVLLKRSYKDNYKLSKILLEMEKVDNERRKAVREASEKITEWTASLTKNINLLGTKLEELRENGQHLLEIITQYEKQTEEQPTTSEMQQFKRFKEDLEGLGLGFEHDS